MLSFGTMARVVSDQGPPPETDLHCAETGPRNCSFLIRNSQQPIRSQNPETVVRFFIGREARLDVFMTADGAAQHCMKGFCRTDMAEASSIGFDVAVDSAHFCTGGSGSLIVA